jgi:multiple sugar transport system permease protein
VTLAVRARATSRISVLGALRGLVLLGFAVYCLVPLVWLLLAPSKSDGELVNDSPLSFGALSGFARAWSHLLDYNDGVILRWIINSAYYSGASLILGVGTAMLAGYALAVLDVPCRRALLLVTLVAMMLPPTALVLPLFLEIEAVHLTNTAMSVVLPASFYPFGAYLAFIYFSTSLPREIVEAARIDGCSEVGLFWYIAMPLARALIALLAFFSFVANWNNFFLPYVMLTEEAMYNLPVGLGALIAGTPALNPAMGGTYLPITRPEVALAGLIVVAPIAVVFVISQRALVRGLVAGSVKP